MHRPPPLFRWTRSSTILMSGFFLVIFLIIYIWWPLAEEVLSYIDWKGPWWLYIDWLLIGIFLFMSLTIVARADLRRDSLILLVAAIGGLVIESWGTQTNLWFYYTNERPPLWIIPAWPIATLSIDRITRALGYFLPKGSPKPYRILYWVTFISFYVLMLFFVAPTFDKSYTVLALLALHPPHPHTHRPSFGFPDLYCRCGSRLFPRAVGHHPPMLDLLHLSNPASFCGSGARHGRCRILAGRITGQIDRSKITAPLPQE